MPHNLLNAVKKYVIAFSAVWLIFCAFGSGFLHDSIGCSHDMSAETVEHHEEDHAHWAGVKSDLFTSADCPVCITCESFGIDHLGAESSDFAIPSGSVEDSQTRTPITEPLFFLSTRAPPVS